MHNHPLASYSSWKIGGPAEYFYCPRNITDLCKLFKIWRKNSITVLGAATNVLIRDKGIKGLTIYLRNNSQNIQILDQYTVWVSAGTSIAHLVKTCTELGMSSAAFLAGIPGTIGGALAMNAGAYGHSIWDYVESVNIINRQGDVKKRTADKFIIGYRKISGLDLDEWFISANLTFEITTTEKAMEQVHIFLQKRQDSQPLNLPSCGSVFRNPDGDYAARLITSCGLKNKRIGDAQVSDKHSNFIVNCGNATSHDVETLIQHIITTVNKSTGVTLVPEVRIIGDK